jgi:hypothetical protein
MKTLALVALIALSTAAAFADDGGAGYGTEDVIAAGGLTTIAGGCADARVIGSGENTEIVYTEPCQYAPTSERRYVKSDYFTVFKTAEEAEANCNVRDYVQSVVNFRLQVIGWACAPVTHDNGGSNYSRLSLLLIVWRPG